ncbi:MAG: hypothetical protein RIS70_3760 [Planctomycetota bacterium]
MSFARIKSVRGPLRFRLAAWNASVVVLTVLATLLGMRQGLYYALIAELDVILLEDARELQLALNDLNYPESTEIYSEMSRKAEAHELRDWYVRFLNPTTNTQLWASSSAPPQMEPPRGHPDLDPVTIKQYRIVQCNVPRPGGEVLVRIGSSLQPIAQDMARIDRNAVLICIGLAIFAPLCGYWLAQRATEPFAAMIHTTASLQPAQLSDRLVVRGTNDELDQLAQQVNKLLDRIALYLQTKRDFVANAAHELRSPLAAIRSAIEVALNEPRSAQQYQEVLEGLLEETVILTGLVSQLLLLAETEAEGPLVATKPIQLDDVLRRSVDMFGPVAEDRGIQMSLTPSSPIWVKGNRHYLRQVMNNLLDNALKFTATGGTIQVAVERDKELRNVTVRVSDTGAGIAPEDLPHIFERFFRSDRSRPRSGETRGTGLGLSICQAIVHLHSGTISAESQLGKGTTFIVSLPLLDSPPQDLAVSDTPSATNPAHDACQP